MRVTLGGQNQGALKDIRVVEMGTLIAGPFCGQLMGDMGAEVIKIEPPETPAEVRCGSGAAASRSGGR